MQRQKAWLAFDSFDDNGEHGSFQTNKQTNKKNNGEHGEPLLFTRNGFT